MNFLTHKFIPRTKKKKKKEEEEEAEKLLGRTNFLNFFLKPRKGGVGAFLTLLIDVSFPTLGNLIKQN